LAQYWWCAGTRERPTPGEGDCPAAESMLSFKLTAPHIKSSNVLASHPHPQKSRPPGGSSLSKPVIVSTPRRSRFRFLFDNRTFEPSSPTTQRNSRHPVLHLGFHRQCAVVPSAPKVSPEDVSKCAYCYKNDDGCQHTRPTINGYRSSRQPLLHPKYSDASFANQDTCRRCEHVPCAPHLLCDWPRQQSR